MAGDLEVEKLQQLGNNVWKLGIQSGMTVTQQVNSSSMVSVGLWTRRGRRILVLCGSVSVADGG